MNNKFDGLKWNTSYKNYQQKILIPILKKLKELWLERLQIIFPAKNYLPNFVPTPADRQLVGAYQWRQSADQTCYFRSYSSIL